MARPSGRRRSVANCDTCRIKESVGESGARSGCTTGESVTAAAKTAKVSRQTGHRWMKAPDFQAAFNAARNDLRSEMETRLENIASKAFADTLKKAPEYYD